MVMTKGDIIQEYKQAKNHRAQITILADQNLISEQAIVDILLAGGCDVPMGYKYRKLPNSSYDKASVKSGNKAKPKKEDPDPAIETETVTIRRSEATKMIAEQAALDTVREFLKDHEKSWDEFCYFMGGVVDLVCMISKRCG